jgi:hypothetical protein
MEKKNSEAQKVEMEKDMKESILLKEFEKKKQEEIDMQKKQKEIIAKHIAIAKKTK